jgi:uncharacterized protein (DUF2147 family)
VELQEMVMPCITWVALLCLGLVTTAALAADPRGTWFTEQQESQVQISECGTELCGTIVALKEPNDPKTGKPWTDEHNPDPKKRSQPLIGVQVVLGMKSAGSDKWSGEVYNTTDGKTYRGNITMTGDNAMKLQGCVMGGLICKSQTWVRAQ